MSRTATRPYVPPSLRCAQCGNPLAVADELPDSTEWHCAWCGFRAWARAGRWLTPMPAEERGRGHWGARRGWRG